MVRFRKTRDRVSVGLFNFGELKREAKMEKEGSDPRTDLVATGGESPGFAQALIDARRGSFNAAASLALAAVDEARPVLQHRALADAVEVAIVLHDRGADETVWKPLQTKILEMLSKTRDIYWARLRLLDQGGMQQISGPPLQAGRWTGKDPEAIRIARESGTEDDFCRTLLVYDWYTVADIEGILLQAGGWSSEENLARALSVAAETLMYRHGEFDRACTLLEEQWALQERRGSIVEQAKSLVRLTMALLANGELRRAIDTRDAARRMVEQLGPDYVIFEHSGTTRGGDLYPEISMESNFAWYVEGNWSLVAEHWVKAIALEEPGGSPVHIVEAAMAAQAYARLGEIANASHYLDELTIVLKQLQPRDWAFNGAVGRASHAIWDMCAVRYASDYRAMALEMLLRGVGDWTNTSLEQTVARMSALLGNASESRDYFQRARRRLGGKPDDPRAAILDFDEAVAIRLCPAIGLSRREPLLSSAIEGFNRNGMGGWVDRVQNERENTKAGR
jgi:tetratricopeptide (TPR) repeat protein